MYFVIVFARLNASEEKSFLEIVDLMNAIHNIPASLDRNEMIEDDILLRELEEIEKKYHSGEPIFSSIIKNQW